ncbi:MAG: GNAT family protein [Candidatus Diapherotrites archaeon]|nr:GNAT family protein [Candidatus Diapherotrites archaeon]
MKKFVLRTKRLLLRPLKLSDVDTILPNANDWFQTRFLKRVEPPMSRKKDLIWIRSTWKEWKKGSGFTFAAGLATTGELVGTLSLDSVSKTHRKASVGIFFYKRYWGNGYGTEAVDRLVRFGFEKLKLNRIEYGFIAQNKRSERIFKRLGFTREGVQRGFVFKRGKFRDHVFGSILASDWKRRKKKK